MQIKEGLWWGDKGKGNLKPSSATPKDVCAPHHAATHSPRLHGDRMY